MTVDPAVIATFAMPDKRLQTAAAAIGDVWRRIKIAEVPPIEHGCFGVEAIAVFAGFNWLIDAANFHSRFRSIAKKIIVVPVATVSLPSGHGFRNSIFDKRGWAGDNFTLGDELVDIGIA